VIANHLLKAIVLSTRHRKVDWLLQCYKKYGRPCSAKSLYLARASCSL